MPVDLETYYSVNKPKTDQLNADDLLTTSITVTIEDANNSKSEGPLALSISGGWKPYKPCFTMRKLLEFAWNDKNPNTWIGKSLTLYRDPDVVNRGEVVGGIRVSHVSHITSPKTCKLTETRGQRKAWTVLPLVASDVKTNKPLPTADEFTKMIEAATSSEELDTIAKLAVKAKLKADELEFIKMMVTTARERLNAAD